MLAASHPAPLPCAAQRQAGPKGLSPPQNKELGAWGCLAPAPPAASTAAVTPRLQRLPLLRGAAEAGTLGAATAPACPGAALQDGQGAAAAELQAGAAWLHPPAAPRARLTGDVPVALLHLPLPQRRVRPAAMGSLRGCPGAALAPLLLLGFPMLCLAGEVLVGSGTALGAGSPPLQL